MQIHITHLNINLHLFIQRSIYSYQMRSCQCTYIHACITRICICILCLPYVYDTHRFMLYATSIYIQHAGATGGADDPGVWSLGCLRLRGASQGNLHQSRGLKKAAISKPGSRIRFHSSTYTYIYIYTYLYVYVSIRILLVCIPVHLYIYIYISLCNILVQPH